MKLSALFATHDASEIGQSAELHTGSDGRAFQDFFNFDDPGDGKVRPIPANRD